MKRDPILPAPLIACALLLPLLSGCTGSENTSASAPSTSPPSPSGPSGSPTGPSPGGEPIQDNQNETSSSVGTVAFTERGSVRGTLLLGLICIHPECDIEAEGVDFNNHLLDVVDRDENGTAVGATNLILNVTNLGPTPANLDLYLLGPDGEVVANDSDGIASYNHFGPAGINVVTAPLARGQYTARVMLLVGTNVDYELQWAIQYTYI